MEAQAGATCTMEAIPVGVDNSSPGSSGGALPLG